MIKNGFKPNEPLVLKENNPSSTYWLALQKHVDKALPNKKNIITGTFPTAATIKKDVASVTRTEIIYILNILDFHTPLA